jgi:hypothetical protein
MIQQEDVRCVKQANATCVLMRYDTRNVRAAKVALKRVATPVVTTIWCPALLDRKNAAIGFALIVKMDMSDYADIPCVIIMPSRWIGFAKTVVFAQQNVRARSWVF